MWGTRAGHVNQTRPDMGVDIQRQKNRRTVMCPSSETLMDD
jgi:hypothetical protein